MKEKKEFEITQEVEIYLSGVCYTIPCTYKVYATNEISAQLQANFYKSRMLTNFGETIIKDLTKEN